MYVSCLVSDALNPEYNESGRFAAEAVTVLNRLGCERGSSCMRTLITSKAVIQKKGGCVQC